MLKPRTGLLALTASVLVLFGCGGTVPEQGNSGSSAPTAISTALDEEQHAKWMRELDRRLVYASEHLGTDADCRSDYRPAADVPVVEVLRFEDGCLLLDHEPLAGRTLTQARTDLYPDPTVIAVDYLSEAAPESASDCSVMVYPPPPGC